VSTPDPFDTATFFDCNEDGDLHSVLDTENDTAEKAIFRHIAWWGVDKITYPLVVHAWAPDEILAPWFDSIAAHLHDIAVEAWEADFGDPEDNDSLPPEVADELLVGMTTVIRILKKARPWRCHKVGSREYTREQVLAIMGDEDL